jgi:hypothetical protein
LFGASRGGEEGREGGTRLPLFSKSHLIKEGRVSRKEGGKEGIKEGRVARKEGRKKGRREGGKEGYKGRKEGRV